MERRSIIRTFASGFLALSALALLSCKAPAQQTLRMDGSSTVFPISEAVAEEFQRSKRGAVRVTVGISGTGGGFKKFCRGETDVSNASRPILREEIEACRQAGISYIELPIAFDALTIAVHPQNDWAGRMTLAELKTIWEPAAQGKITHWNQVRPEWPNQPLKLFGAGSDSGTFDYFTEAVTGKAKASRGDFTASEDDNVLVQGIETDRYALGYIPYAYYEPHKTRLKAVAVDSGKGAAVAPSAETVENGSYTPLSRPLFIYVNAEASQRPAVREYVEFLMKNGPSLIREVQYVPLPQRAYEVGLQRLTAREVGTAFGGTPEVGLSIDEILARQPKP